MSRQFSVECICPVCNETRIMQSSTNKSKIRKCKSCYHKARKKPVGSEFIDKNGYVRMKFSDSPSKWVYKHRYIWELYNNEIPRNYCIHHIDGNRLNNDISNLELILANRHNNLSYSSEKYKTAIKNRKIPHEKNLPIDQLTELINSGKSLRKIGTIFGCTHGVVKRNLNEFGIQIPQKPIKAKTITQTKVYKENVSKITKEKLIKFMNTKLSQRQIAKLLDVSHTTVQRLIKQFNL